MKKILTILIISFSFAAQSQVLQTPQIFGTLYRNLGAKEGLVIPTFCGTPTLPPSVKNYRQSAIAYDSCNHIFYVFSPTDSTWKTISGSGLDSLSFHSASLNSDSTQLSLTRANGTKDTIEVWGDGFVGGSLTTASNGLTMVGNDIQLGDSLTKNTYIHPNGYTFKMTGVLDSINNYVQYNSSTVNPSFAIYLKSNQQQSASNFTPNDISYSLSDSLNHYSTFVDQRIVSGSGYGTWWDSASVTLQAHKNVNGVVSTSTLNLMPVITTLSVDSVFQVTNTGLYNFSNFSVKPVLNLIRKTSGTALNGIGGSIDIYTVSDSAVGGNHYVRTYLSNQLISKWSTAQYLSRTSEFSITGVNNAVTNTLLQISGAGVFTLTQGLSNYANNAAAITGGLTVGQLYRNGDAVQIVH